MREKIITFLWTMVFEKPLEHSRGDKEGYIGAGLRRVLAWSVGFSVPFCL